MTAPFIPATYDYKPASPFYAVIIDGSNSIIKCLRMPLEKAVVTMWSMQPDNNIAALLFDRHARIVYSTHDGHLWGVEDAFKASEVVLAGCDDPSLHEFLHLGFEIAARVNWPVGKLT